MRLPWIDEPTPPASGRRAIADGLVAGAASVVAALGMRLGLGIATMPELLQDRLIRALPGPVFSLLLNRLHYLGKPLFFAALLVAQVLAGAALAMLIRRTGRAVPVTMGAWLVAGGVLLPLAGHPPFDGSAGVALSLALSSAAFLVTLLVLWRPVAAAPGAPPATRLRERREVIAGIGLLVLGVAMARQVIGRLPSLPVLTGRLPPPITPADDFYVVSKNLVDPTVALDGWRLAVDGLVERPLALTYREITALPSEEFVRTLECISNEIGGDLISTGRFTGVPLATVLRMAGVRPGAAVLHFTSVDGYTENMPIAKAMDPATFLVYRLDGEPLPPKHGFPLRVLGAGTYGMKNPKWLQRIEVVTEAAEGYWTQQGWTPDAVVQTMSRIDVPGAGALSAGDIPLAGIAYSGDRGIRQVEVSTDGGETWQAAALDPPLGPLTWVFWRLLARLDPGPGSIEVRATDGTGAVQPEIESDTFPNGATGHHRVEVRVTG